jgi:hypothetical protein
MRAAAAVDIVPLRHAIIAINTRTTGARIAAENLLSIARTKHTTRPAIFAAVSRRDARHRK